MNDRVIYYPYINVPKNEWLARAVLYWDAVGFILPQEYDPYEGSRTRRGAVVRHDFTMELVAADLVTPIEPDRAFEIPGFIEDFLTLLDSYPQIRAAGGVDPRKAMPIKVHRGKLDHELLGQLRRRELVVGPSRSGTWIPVERTTAELYVAYLAARLGALRDVEMTPVTDERDSLRVFELETAGDLARVGAALAPYDVRSAVLSQILPAPAWAEVGQLHEFKEEHYEQLKRMRRRVEQDVRIVAAVSDADRHAASRDVVASFREETEELRRRMTEHRWQKVGWATVAVTGALGPMVTALHGGDPVMAVESLPAMMLGLKQAVDFTGAPDLKLEPLAYAVIAQKSFETGSRETRA